MPIVSTGLTSHWDHKDGTGTTITDIVGTSDGTLGGTTTNFWDRTDRNGAAVGQFNGSDNEVTASGVTFPTGDFSVCALVWVTRSTWDDNRGVIRFHDGSGVGFGIRLLDPEGFQFFVKDATTTTAGWADQSAELFEYWAVLQAGFRASDSAMFFRVNELEDTQTAAEAPTDPGTSFQIGLSAFGSQWFDGRIADVLWYDGKFLSAAERTQNFDALMERARGAVTISTDDASVSKTIRSLPHDGNADLGARERQTVGMFTTASNIYVADTEDVSGTSVQPTITRFNKSWVVQETVTPFGSSSDDDSHRAVAVGVDSDGLVHLIEGVHGAAWSSLISDAAEDLSSLSSVASPDLDGTESENFTYPELWVRPSTGELFARYQQGTGSPAGAYWWKWNSATSNWDRLPGVKLWEGNAVYMPTMAEDSAGNLYANASFRNAAGGPWRMVAVAKSTDGGANWTDMDGNALTEPISREETSIAIPRSVDDVELYDNAGASLVTDGTQLHGIARWKNELEGDSVESVWYFRWDATSESFELHKLYAASTNDAGTPDIGYHDGTLFVIATTRHRSSATSITYLWTSDDGGDTWTRHILDPDTGTRGTTDIRHDPTSLVQDSLVRVKPYFEASPTDAEVWEFSLPSGGVTAAPTNLTATAVSATQVDLSWDAVSGATGYDVRRGGTIIATDVGVTTYSDTSPDGSTLYEVRAVDS